MADVPFMNGKDVTVSYFVNGTALDEFQCKSWSIKRNCTDIADGVCGEDRDRLDSITNFFEIEIELFNKTAKKLDAFFEDQANEDAFAPPTNKSAALVFKARDGSKSGCIADEISLGAWDMGSGGRTDRVMVKMPLRARYCKKAAV